MATYAIEDTTLTAIANAIRGKNGQTTKYTPAQMATAITAISGGGGLPTGFSKIATGTYTVSTAFTTTRQTVTHGLDVVPDFVMFFSTKDIATTYSMLFAIRSSLMNYRSGYNSYWAYHPNNSTTNVTMGYSNNANYGVSNLTATTFQIASASSSYYWRAGTYQWLAIKFS